MEQILFKMVMAGIGAGAIAIVYFAAIWLFEFLKKTTLGVSRDDRFRNNPPSTIEPTPRLAAHEGTPPSSVSVGNDIYAEIANELETGNTDKGLWTRLFAECDGDENRTKVAYIKHRAAARTT